MCKNIVIVITFNETISSLIYEVILRCDATMKAACLVFEELVLFLMQKRVISHILTLLFEFRLQSESRTYIGCKLLSLALFGRLTHYQGWSCKRQPYLVIGVCFSI